MIDIYFKCDWCKQTVEHRHHETGSHVSEGAKKLHYVQLTNSVYNYICENCYQAIQNKIENLCSDSEQEDIPAVPRKTERCEKPADAIYVEYTDKDRLTFDKNMPEVTRTSSKDYQDDGVIVTCENK